MTTATTTTALDDVLATIDDANLSTEDLRSVNSYVVDSIKASQRRDAALVMAKVRPGDTVRIIPGTLRPSADREFGGKEFPVTTKYRTKVALDVGGGRIIKFPASILEKV